jgi:hypothetical protein
MEQKHIHLYLSGLRLLKDGKWIFLRQQGKELYGLLIPTKQQDELFSIIFAWQRWNFLAAKIGLVFSVFFVVLLFLPIPVLQELPYSELFVWLPEIIQSLFFPFEGFFKLTLLSLVIFLFFTGGGFSIFAKVFINRLLRLATRDSEIIDLSGHLNFYRPFKIGRQQIIVAEEEFCDFEFFRSSKNYRHSSSAAEQELKDKQELKSVVKFYVVGLIIGIAFFFVIVLVMKW